jgi:predicted dithiol-disulfide oxidoreductase (DUF899 family)
MGRTMPCTITDSFDADFGVDEHGHNVFFRNDERVFRILINSGREAMGTTWSYLDITPLGRQETGRTRQRATPRPRRTSGGTGDNYDAELSPDPKWVEVSDAGEAAFRKHDAEAS